MNRKKIVVVVGPTASGKTKFGIEICKKLREKDVYAEIINADAMQIYEGFDIGTAKPTKEDRLTVPHHLMGIVSPLMSYNANMFVSQCSKIIEELFSRHTLPIVVGGTNLYIEALLWPSVIDLQAPRKDDSLGEEYAGYGSEKLYTLLKKMDPIMAAKIHPNDQKRIIRSLEILNTYSIRHSELIEQRLLERDRTGPKYDAIIFTLQCEAEQHRQRIKERVSNMLRDGLIDECKQLMKIMETSKITKIGRGIFQSIAYKEIMPILTDNSVNYEDDPSEFVLTKCIDVLERKTWQYARRQNTWIRNRFQKQRDLKVYSVKTTDLSKWDFEIIRATDEILSNI